MNIYPIQLYPSGYTDTFARDHLPSFEQWPELIFELPELQYSQQLNAAVELLDQVAIQHPDQVALLADGQSWNYGQLLERVNQIAHVLSEELGLIPGNRVLLHGPNTPMLAACWLAILKAGGIAVSTMPLLRGPELLKVMDKAQVSHALIDQSCAEAFLEAQGQASTLQQVKWFAADGGQLLEESKSKPTTFKGVSTSSDDVALIAFTSGTTGQPKGCMHFHRDLLAICDTFAKHVVQAKSDDIFIGSPPFAFTFGLGVSLLFPLRVGGSVVLLPNGSPPKLAAAIQQFGATICATAPTSYRMMASLPEMKELKSLRKCISAGEVLPAATRTLWRDAVGIELIDGIGATELLHIFISANEEEARAGYTGKAVPGWQACILDADGNPLPTGEIGHLAVKGPVGCRYLADERQQQYVQKGWNMTGDLYRMTEDGYFEYISRSDVMIISSGYNIAAPEVENTILLHSAVAECAVVGLPDEMRGQVISAFVVLHSEHVPSESLKQELQDFVKEKIAPYKYPRRLEFCRSLPKTATGKLQRYQLKELEDQKIL